MSNSVAITSPRDNLPAQRLLLFAIIAALILALPGLAHGKTRGKLTRSNYPAVSRPAPPVKPVVATGSVATVSLRAANDGIAPKTAVDPSTAGLVGGLTVGRASNASANAIAGPMPPALPQKGTTTWYPESHSYLRPYHYKWRYWTPG